SGPADGRIGTCRSLRVGGCRKLPARRRAHQAGACAAGAEPAAVAAFPGRCPPPRSRKRLASSFGQRMTQLPPLPVRAPRLSQARRLAVYLISSGIWATGALWLLFHYFFVRETAFGPSPHPLEFWSRAAHGAFGFAALWLFGVLWGAHVIEGWRSLRRRW